MEALCESSLHLLKNHVSTTMWIVCNTFSATGTSDWFICISTSHFSVPLCVSQRLLVQAHFCQIFIFITLFLLPTVGKSSQQRRSGSSGAADHGAQGTHSLGHKRAPLTGLKPQTDKVGTLPRRKDNNTDGKLSLLDPQPLFVRESSAIVNSTRSASIIMPHLYRLPNTLIYHPLNSPHTGREVPAQRGFPHAQLVGSCSLRPLWGVHGDRVDAGAAAYGFLERHNNIQQGHPE